MLFNRFLCVALALFLGIACSSQPSSSNKRPLPVLPGAKGFGTETPAGRGGKILKVTNLNDSGSGSLRAAVEASGPRIVVFEVSGTIPLSNHIKAINPYITIAGQTAPSPGITLKGGTLAIQTHDVLVQHIRSRSGDNLDGPLPEVRDAWKIGPDNSGAYNVVLDHTTGSWGVDEVIGIGRGAHDITVSNSIISEGLDNSLHPKGAHSMGLLIYDEATNISVLGNLLAHNADRNPLIKGGTSSVFLNNLVYNASGSQFVQVVDDYNRGPSDMSIVGNVFIPGANTASTAPAIRFYSSSVKPGTRCYANDNIHSNALADEDTYMVNSAPVWHSSLTAKDSSTVEPSVLANAGARPADRDSVDERIVHEVKTRTGNIIDSQQQVGGWPTLPKNVRPFSTPANPNGDDDGDGYTNIEEILHQMAAQVEGR